ncbi:hypothetical protein Btru_043373 [Bulinus truncatus]|nr:hypothetical protein Btru_043373 [Bulinus truncatus]
MASLNSVLVCGLCCLCLCTAAKSPDIVYLHDSCGAMISVLGDALIRIASHPVHLRPGNCTIDLVPSWPLGQLVAQILKYSMDEKYTNDEDCPYESIQLKSPTNSSLLGPHGYCKSSRPTGQYFLTKEGVYSYSADGKYDDAPTVELLVTEVEFENVAGYCPAGLFECDWKDICIHQNLRCNGYDDCGNGNDEKDCAGGGGLSWWIILIIVVVIVIIFILIVVFVVKHHRKGYQNIVN